MKPRHNASQGPPPRRALMRATIRAVIPLAAGDVVNGIAFGAIAAAAGLSAVAAVGMSLLSFSAGAQTLAVTGMAQHESLLAIMLTVALLNLRFLVLGALAVPRLPAGRLHNSARLLTLTDASWVLASRIGGDNAGYYALVMVTAGATSLACWTLGTLLGALGVTLGGIDPYRWGLDVILPALFVWLVSSQPPRRAAIAFGIGGISFAATSAVLPATYSMLTAGVLAAVIGLRR